MAHTNRLADSASPYLLQHAHNPVNWFPWGEEALTKAKTEDKPIIVSIGYSACHWCHVMERECFEKDALAAIMNDHFISIKVDREERPDIDQIYMDAVQNMGIRGGWPLNVFLTPQGEPFYGGTYFPAPHWNDILLQITTAFKNNRNQIEESAKSFTSSLNVGELEKYNLIESGSNHQVSDLELAYLHFSKQFDTKLGGMNREPKFPMPANYLFLLRIWHATQNQEALSHVVFTLKKMALGGIFDQVGGGFARYSTDAAWFLPHFEKMLYDNGQLVSLYSEAYSITKDPLFKEVVYQTIAFIKRELTSPEYGFYSALDADSEGEEGKFYVWTYDALKSLIKNDFELFCDYFNIEEEGNWENGNNILNSNYTIEEFAIERNITSPQMEARIQEWKQILLAERSKRIRPGLDDKILTSWNGIMLNGLVDAFKVFNDEQFLQLALKNAEFLKANLSKDSMLFHSYKDRKASITGFLDDYAFVIQAYINLYQATFDEKWLDEAQKLATYSLDQFIDEKESFMFFTAKNSEKLIARKKEIFDNVIPSSNSVMAINLYWLGLLLEHDFSLEFSQSMLSLIKNAVIKEPGFTSNWGNLLYYKATTTKEIAISGPKLNEYAAKINSHYFPNRIMVGTLTASAMPLLKNREALGEKTLIYVCENKACQLPVETVEEAQKLFL